MAQKVQLNKLELEPLQGELPGSASETFRQSLTLRDAPKPTLFLFGSSNAKQPPPRNEQNVAFPSGILHL